MGAKLRSLVLQNPISPQLQSPLHSCQSAFFVFTYGGLSGGLIISNIIPEKFSRGKVTKEIMRKEKI